MNDETLEPLAQRQKDFSLAIAEKLERGEPLSSIERKWAAEAIRAAASQIKPKEKKLVGRPSKITELALVDFHLLRTFQGLSVKAAEITLSERYGVSTAVIHDRLLELKKTTGLTGWGLPAIKKNRKTKDK